MASKATFNQLHPDFFFINWMYHQQLGDPTLYTLDSHKLKRHHEGCLSLQYLDQLLGGLIIGTLGRVSHSTTKTTKLTGGAHSAGIGAAHM